MCKIGQNNRCKTTGCEWSKCFGVNCYSEKIKTMTFPAFWDELGCLSIEKKEIKNNGRSIKTVTKRRKIYNKTNGICYLCGTHVSFSVFSIDHVIPKSKGGTNSLDNLMPAHKECNFKKADKILNQ
jgi:5-methylcytosine-specific restriction endonuclease McrA